MQIRGVVYDLYHKRGDVDSCFSQSVATDVNSSDQVTGVILRGSGEKRGFIWGPGRPTPVLLARAPWGGIDDVALAINKYGLVAGYAESALAIQATLWRGGTPINIHPAGYGNSRALDLDDYGYIVGVADGIVGYWTPNFRFVPSGFRAGREVNNFFRVSRFPVSISPSGVIAFSSTPPGGGRDEAYVWDFKRGLPPVRQTLVPRGISAINDKMTIAGWEHGSGFGPRQPFVRRDMGFDRLPSAAGSREAWPQAISECGAIAGVARKPDFGTTVAVLWTWSDCP